MKKNNFYKKAGLSFLFVIGFGCQTYAQNISSIDEALKDTLIKVTDRNPFKITNQKAIDKTVWVFMRSSGTTDTIVGDEASTGKFGLGWVYILQNGKWRYNTFYSCGYSTPCYASDLLVVNGLTYATSNKYPIDDMAYWLVPGAIVISPTISSLIITEMSVAKTFVEVVAKSNGILYSQKIDVNGMLYDSISTRTLQSPIVANATYQWYRNGNLILGAKDAAYTPTETGTYTVIITWTEVNASFANARTEEDIVRTATFTFNVTKIATPTGLGNEMAENNLISVYPNPATQNVYLSSVGYFEYKLDDINGVTMLSGLGNNTAEFNIENIKAGVYFVNIKNNGTQSVKRLIVR